MGDIAPGESGIHREFLLSRRSVYAAGEAACTMTLAMIWGALRRTWACEMIAVATAPVVGTLLTWIGLGEAAVPAGVVFGLGCFVALAAYSHRYGRL